LRLFRLDLDFVFLASKTLSLESSKPDRVLAPTSLAAAAAAVEKSKAQQNPHALMLIVAQPGLIIANIPVAVST
jgi:hypothetical protein